MINLNDFKDWLMARKKCLTYLALVRVWLNYLEKKGITDITAETITTFFQTPNKWGREYAIESRNGFIKAMKVYYGEYLNQPDNAWLKERGIRPYKRLPKDLSYEEVVSIIAFLKIELKKIPTYKIEPLLLTMFYCGLRLSEIVSLRREQINLNNEPCVITFMGKGRKEHRVLFNKKYAPNLKEILLNYFSLEPERTSAFNTTKAQLYYLLKKASEIRGRNITPHLFRHGSARDSARKGIPINLIQKKLNHQSLLTTQKYLEVSDGEEQRFYSA